MDHQIVFMSKTMFFKSTCFVFHVNERSTVEIVEDLLAVHEQSTDWSDTVTQHKLWPVCMAQKGMSSEMH